MTGLHTSLLRLRVGCDTLRAAVVRGGAVIWSAEAVYANLAELSDAIGRLAAEPPRRCTRVAVAIERPPVQLRTLTYLPPVNPRALAALVAHQAGRFFRKNGKPLATDAVWLGTGAKRVARAAAVEESVVEAIVAGAQAAGLVIDTIAPAEEAAPLVLLPIAERAARERAERAVVRRLGVGAAGVWGAVGVLFLLRLQWERRAVERELVALGAPVSALVAARRELRDAEATIGAVTRAEQASGRSVAALGAIAAALPDSAVLASLTWRSDGTGVVAGSARRAADVVARLERANAVPGPRLEGPVVREAIAGREWERFTIVFGRDAGGESQDGGGGMRDARRSAP